MSNPFGTDISADDVRDTLQFFDDWEDRYRYVIDLGRQLPGLPEELKTDASLVRGCQSQVWLHVRREGDRLYFDVDSDAHIVRGLLAILLSAYNGRTPAEIRAFDVEAFLDELQLLAHLSPTRGNGLRAMIERIRQEAAAG